MKLKNLLNENMFLGELPSSKLMKMKWNPVTNAEGINEANPRLASGLKALLQVGATINKNVGEDALIKLSDKFDRIDDEYAGDIASHLDMAIELMQDGYGGNATNKLKQFNKACQDVLKGKSIKSAFAEGIREANSDGTISPDEDRRREVLMKKVSTEASKLVAMIKAEAKSIGGKFRAPGIEADARNVIRKSEIWGWMNR
jgi:hypothetical protein